MFMAIAFIFYSPMNFRLFSVYIYEFESLKRFANVYKYCLASAIVNNFTVAISDVSDYITPKQQIDLHVAIVFFLYL